MQPPLVTAFTCQHLAEGVACGFHCAEPSEDDPWPDAWCDACEHVLAKEGDWNDISEGFAEITLQCSSCYEAARERNSGPELINGLGAPATALEIENLIQRSVGLAQLLNYKADQRFGLMTHQRWDFNDEAGTLTFSSDGVPKLVGDVQLAGSFSDNTKTWLWAWANSGNADHLIYDSKRLLTFGIVRGWNAMTIDEPQSCTIEYAWEYAAVATVVTDDGREELIEHVLEKEIVSEEDGRLILGEQGKKLYGGRNFMALYVVFSIPSVLKVMWGPHEIGTIDGFIAQFKEDDDLTFVLGNKPWRVTHIDWRRATSCVELSPKGGNPSWMGEPHLLSCELC